MNRALVPLVCLAAVALALPGCKVREPAAEAAPPPIGKRPAPAHTVALDDDDDAPRAEAEEGPEAPLVIDDGVVRRYLGYWKKSIEVSHRAMEDMARVNKEAERKGGMTGATHALGNGEAIEERAEAQHEALLQEYGFTERQVQELSGLMLAVANGNEAPAADARKSLQEARERYGDAAVDAALRHSEEIVKLHKKTFGMLK